MPVPNLLAEGVDSLEVIQLHLQRDQSSSQLMVVIAVAIVCVIVGLVLTLVDHLRQTNPERDLTAAGLFEELCELHRVNEHERQLLVHAVTQRTAHVPALVFLDASILEAYCHEAESGPSFRALVGKLFGSAPSNTTAAEAPRA